MGEMLLSPFQQAINQKQATGGGIISSSSQIHSSQKISSLNVDNGITDNNSDDDVKTSQQIGSLDTKSSIINLEQNIFFNSVQDISDDEKRIYEPTAYPTKSSIQLQFVSGVDLLSITSNPTMDTTQFPSYIPPTESPTLIPTTLSTNNPTTIPTIEPSFIQSNNPSTIPTSFPTESPTSNPAIEPSYNPSAYPTSIPTTEPSYNPTIIPTSIPTDEPSFIQSNNPSSIPSLSPTESPTSNPTNGPSYNPTAVPSSVPTFLPSFNPSSIPTFVPSNTPSYSSSASPTVQTTSTPSSTPSTISSLIPSLVPTSLPTESPSVSPTSVPTNRPTVVPTVKPTTRPSRTPTSRPSNEPTVLSTNPKPIVSFNSNLTVAGVTSDSLDIQAKRAIVNATASTMGISSSFVSIVGITHITSTRRLLVHLDAVSNTFLVNVKTTLSLNDFSGADNSSFLYNILTKRLDTAVTTGSFTSSLYNNSLALGSTSTLSAAISSISLATSVVKFPPTNQPTMSPTVTPTSIPTGTPTFSIIDKWRNQLNSLHAFDHSNLSASVVQTSDYLELYYSNSFLVGSCGSWSSFVTNELVTNEYQYVPIELSLVSSTSSTSGASFDTALATCNNKSVVRDMHRVLTSDSNSTALNYFTCDGSSWVVGLCSVGSARSLCANCTDPCSSSAYCSQSLASYRSISPFTISPCVSSSCITTQVNSEIRGIVFKYANLENPPEIASIVTVPFKTSIMVTVTADGSGSVYCVASTSPPESILSIKLNNFVSSLVNNQSSVQISGLSPYTAYTIYCSTVSTSGVNSALTTVLSRAVSVTTLCCKSVSAKFSRTSTVSDQFVLNMLTVTLDARPSEDLTVTVQGTDLSDNSTIQGFSPSTFVFSSYSLVTSYSSSLYALLEGKYRFDLVLSGLSDYEYSASSLNSLQSYQYISVISSETEPPTPVLSSAQFSSDGSFITIEFDADTNRGGVSTNFICNKLFDFTCASTSSCSWTDPSTVNAYIAPPSGTSSSNCVSFGSRLAIISSAKIKAACLASKVTCSSDSWEIVSNSSSVAIQNAIVPIVPKINIIAPSVIGSCQSLTVDASSSSGSGSRSWSNISIAVGSLTANVSAMNQYLSSKFTVSPPTVIPASIIPTSASFYILLKMCNFLGQCSQTSKQVSVIASLIPVASIPGDSVKQITKASVLRLDSVAFVQQCGGSTSTSGLSLTWSVTKNNAQLFQLVSTSKDPTKFRLPSYSFPSLGNFLITLTVQITATQKSSSTSVLVVVQPGKIYASLSVGRTVSVRKENTLTISGASSYDDDQYGVSAFDAKLVFQWSSQQIYPSLNSSCSSFLTESYDSYGTLSVFAKLSGVVNSQCLIALTVTDANNTRSSQTSTTVTILSSLTPTISLTSNVASDSLFVASNILRLTATVKFPSSYTGNYNWSVSDSSFDLSGSSLVSTSSSIIVGFATVSNLYLALAANTLSAGSSLTFSLTIKSTVSSSASITITVNSPPRQGTFSVVPSTGYSYSDYFAFYSSFWQSDSLPLSYQYGFLSISSGVTVVLQTRSELTYASFQLPSGAQSKGYSLTATAQIFDSYLANLTSFDNIVVKVNSSVTFTSLSTSSALNSSSAVIKQAVALSGTSYNTVNCSIAPNCSNLNRQECSSTAHTCGSCLSSTFIGSVGDSNEVCISSTAVGNSSAKCSVDSNCGPFYNCINGGCVLPLKSCVGNCSSNGNCIFTDSSSGQRVDYKCYAGNSKCDAVCECETNYVGSQACDLTLSQQAVVRNRREQLINNIAILMDKEDGDSVNVLAWINLLGVATLRPDQLSSGAISKSLSICNSILDYAKQLQLPYDQLSTVMSIIDSVSKASVYLSKSSTSRRVLTSSDGLTTSTSSIGMNTSATVVSSLDSVMKFIDLIAINQLPSQAATLLTQGQFRIYFKVLAPSSDSSIESVNVSVVTPLTSIEEYNGVKASETIIQFFNYNQSNDFNFKFSAIAIKSELYGIGDLLKSNPLQLSFTEPPCPNPPCYVQTTLPHNQKLEFSSYKVATHNVTCESGVNITTSFTCPSGEILNFNCNGTAGLISKKCKLKIDSSVCNSIRNGVVSSSGCSVVAYSSTNVTCSCPILSNNRRLNRRALSDQSSDVDTFASMIESTTTDFSSTFTSSSNIDTSTTVRSWRVLVSVSTFMAFSLCILLGLNWKDLSDADRAKKGWSDENAFSAWAALVRLKRLSLSTKKVSVAYESPVEDDSINSKGKSQVTLKKIKQIENELRLSDNPLPSIFSSYSLSRRVMDELKNHHRFLNLFCKFNAHYSRSLRVLFVFSTITIMLFFQTLTYDLVNPDESKCSNHKSQSSCLQEKSSYATGESMCKWSSENSNSQNSCSYVQPDESFKVIIFVAVFSALIGGPIVLICHIIITRLLAARTQSQDDDNLQITPTANSSKVVVKVDGIFGQLKRRFAKKNGIVVPFLNESMVPADHNQQTNELDETSISVTRNQPVVNRGFKNGKGAVGISEDSYDDRAEDSSLDSVPVPHTNPLKPAEVSTHAMQEAMSLSDQLIAVRSLAREEEKEILDSWWGLDSEGMFMSTTSWWSNIISRATSRTGTVLSNLLNDLEIVIKKENDELNFLQSIRLKRGGLGNRLLLLFHIDLLHNLKGSLLRAKSARDNEMFIERKVSFFSKMFGWFIIIGMNAFMLLYILLFALEQSSSRQIAWMWSFVSLILIEVFLASTLAALLTHILFPSFIAADVFRGKQELITCIRKYQKRLVEEANLAFANADKDADAFDASKYFFVSKRVSSHFPTLAESKMISMFSSALPLRNYSHSIGLDTASRLQASMQWISQTFFSILFFIINMLLAAPLLFDLLLNWMSTVIGGVIVFLHCELYGIHPALVIVPAFVVGVIIHFVIISSKNSAESQLNNSNQPHAMTVGDKVMMIKPSSGSGSGSPQNQDIDRYNSKIFKSHSLDSSFLQQDELESTLTRRFDKFDSAVSRHNSYHFLSTYDLENHPSVSPQLSNKNGNIVRPFFPPPPHNNKSSFNSPLSKKSTTKRPVPFNNNNEDPNYLFETFDHLYDRSRNGSFDYQKNPQDEHKHDENSATVRQPYHKPFVGSPISKHRTKDTPDSKVSSAFGSPNNMRERRPWHDSEEDEITHRKFTSARSVIAAAQDTLNNENANSSDDTASDDEPDNYLIDLEYRWKKLDLAEKLVSTNNKSGGGGSDESASETNDPSQENTSTNNSNNLNNNYNNNRAHAAKVKSESDEDSNSDKSIDLFDSIIRRVNK
eukprot:gene5469-7572_t